MCEIHRSSHAFASCPPSSFFLGGRSRFFRPPQWGANALTALGLRPLQTPALTKKEKGRFQIVHLIAIRTAVRDPSFFACFCILPTLLSLSGRTQSLFQTTTVGGKRSDCAGSETVADSGTDQKGKGPFSDCASYCYTHGSICGLCAKAPPISPTGFPLKPPLNTQGYTSGYMSEEEDGGWQYRDNDLALRDIINSQRMAICLDEPREAQYMAGFIALQMSKMRGMFEGGEKERSMPRSKGS